jgi:hypothetical protein
MKVKMQNQSYLQNNNTKPLTLIKTVFSKNPFFTKPTEANRGGVFSYG